jgi:threonine dehydrogenase-like Zn-dependent dehydrogenase
MGAGIIGLGVLQVLKAWHSTRVIVADFSQTRLAMAKQLGADHTIDVSEGSTYEKLMQMVGPAKPSLFQREESCAVDIAMECAGRSIGAPGAPAAAEILNIVQNDAKVVLVGTYEEKIEMDLNLIVGKALKVMGAVAFDSEDVGEVLELIRARKVDRKTPVTHEFSLDRAKEAYETQLSVNSSIKVLVKP